MSFSFFDVALICLIYLSILFAIALATERGIIPSKVASHPVVYILSLGIFASALSYYGVIELAENFGYGALAYYMGTGMLFLFAPVALKPLMELARRFQITSMADLLTFRYHSHEVGGLVTLCMLLAVMPLLSLQIQAVADTILLLTNQNHDLERGVDSFDTRDMLALVYCAVIGCFALVFGANREHHKGLITAMAFESVVKLFGMLAVGGFSVYAIFGGMGGLDQWLADHQTNLEYLYEPLKHTESHTLLLVFLSTAVAMPHIFHMAVVENPLRHSTYTVTWAFPLFLLLMALPIFPILWAGLSFGSTIPSEYFSLAVPLLAENTTFTVISFVAGLSAATGAIVSISLAISTMVMNQWILPASSLSAKREVYGQIVLIRRVLVIAVIALAYLFYSGLENRFSLSQLGLISFIAALQLLPGILCVTYWARANRQGLLTGLAIGMGIWAAGLLLPIYIGEHVIELGFAGLSLKLGISHWSDIALWATSLNVSAFIIVSLLSKQSNEERYSAELCSEDELSHPVRMVLDIRDPDEMVERLGERIGRNTARIEVDRALAQLSMNPNERRPYALRRLRDEIEANLSGLLGISLATEIMDTLIPLRVPEAEGATDINLIEDRLNHYREHFSGLAAELDSLRLYHRRTLEQLPMAGLSVGKDREVLMWNNSMQQLSGIASEQVTGSRLDDVLEPWGPLLASFVDLDVDHTHKEQVEIADSQRWLNLHKASIPSSLEHQIDGQVILLEDVTELQMLEDELLHSERLASVGRLAAGVAHEIGNPVTGIDSLAQILKYETDDPEIIETADQILSQTKRVSRIVHSLVSFSHAGRNRGSEYEACNLRECVQEGMNLIALQKEKAQMLFVNEVPEYVQVLGDSQRLIQVFVNLLGNARDACEEGTKVSVIVEQVAKEVSFAVTDEGPGIAPEIQDRILEPFFTTKDPGEGTGLGLAMVYSIIEDHNGQLELISPVDKVLQRGTKFVIKLPNALASAETLSNTSS
ncbi:sensor histidine kinase [Agaribacterium haliotis]|uniref:sensor histidine kinase n=1 Tax=Agaribacterium haliotis TaxID=2013869 RepID=UPI000BB548F9|nr:ATP-binding protein [Agaribacterium haliotis]